MTLGELTDQEARWIAEGKDDLGKFAYHGLGIALHDKQIEALAALDTADALFYFWYWANRAGKTTGVIVKHLHLIYYKKGLDVPRTDYEQDLWLAEDYRTLHTAPIGILATKAHSAIKEIMLNTHPAQRDENNERRPALLRSSFRAATERDAAGADRMVVKSSTGGSMDFFSTEGGAGRLEGSPWRFISWDEWPQQEAADKATAIRTVLTRLENRASDFDAPILLTGTITPETEHIAKEWIDLCEDPGNSEWYGLSATRLDNPSASRKAIARAERNMDAEDYARTVMGMPGGVKGRLLPFYMVDPVFRNDLPKWTPPHPQDGATFVADNAPVMMIRSRRRDETDEEPNRPRGSFRSRSDASPWFYLHVWDLAIAAAANVGMTFRLPADYEFGWHDVEGKRVLVPIEGVQRIEVPGSRTLTSAEIIHTIESAYLLYGGRIVVDSTDAHGKNILRELRRAGYPVEGFGFQERDERRVIRKDTAIHHTRELLTEGMVFRTDSRGEVIVENDVPVWDPAVAYGVLRLPREWHKARDQMTILRPDDDKQTKDEAMVVLMGCETAYRLRRGRTRRIESNPFAVFTSGRTLRG